VRFRTKWTGRAAIPVVAVVAVALIAAGCGSSSKKSSSSNTTATTAAPKTSRGFDGHTVTVAGLGIKGQLPGAEFGAEGRIKRFNDTNELPGVKINYAEFADDKLDPATALSESRRLVTEDKVFAIVGDISANNPGDYFKQQHVPYFGWAFDNTYCTDAPSKDVWGFGYNGCLVPAAPKVMPDTYANFYGFVSKQLNKKNPTVAEFSNDNTSGHNSTKYASFQLKGVGFNVVYAKGSVPLPPVSDYTPYVQQFMTSDGGHPPDAIVCLLAVDCIPIYKGLVAAGYKGYYFHNLYADTLAAPMKGSYASVTFTAFDIPSDGYTQMKTDVAAIKPDYAIDTGVFAGYTSTDMFIQALKAAAKSGGISPENVQAHAANQTWEIKGFAGPTKYPDSSVKPTPACNSLTYSDGTSWKTVVPYTCSDKVWPTTG